MAQIGCDHDKARVIDLSTQTFVKSAGRQNPLEQKYGLQRQNQKITRSMEIALTEHRNMHLLNETFSSLEDLALHQQLMLDAILEGSDLLTAHKFAVEFGPLPVKLIK